MNDVPTTSLPETDVYVPELSTEFKVIGRDADSFITHYIVDNKDSKNSKLGQLFAVLEVLDLEIEESEIEDIAESLMETFRKAFYSGDEELEPYVRFEEALKAVNEVAREVHTERGVSLYQINMSIAALHEDTLFLSQTNDAEIYLVRNNNLTNIAEGLSVGKRKEHSDLFENIATGTLEKKDIVLFSTSRLVRYAAQSDVVRLLSGVSLSEGLEELGNQIYMDVFGRIGVLGLKVETSFYEEEEEIIIPRVDLKSLDWKEKSEYVLTQSKRIMKSTKVLGKDLISVFKKVRKGEKLNLKEILKKKSIKIVGGVLLAGIVLISLSWSGVLDSKTKRNHLELLDQAKKIIASAKSETNRERSAQLILNANEKLDQVMQTKSLRKEADAAMSELNQAKSIIDKMIVVDDIELYADISAKRSDANLLGLIKLQNNYYAYDSHRLYEFIGDLVKNPVTLYEQGKVVSGAGLIDTDTVVFLTEDNRIREYGSGTVKFMNTDDTQYKFSRNLLTYGSRIYLFDKNAGQIWRYSRKRDSYGRAEPSLANIDFDRTQKAVSFAIDGSVYLLYANGDIDKFYGGSLVTDFGLASKPVSIITDADRIFTELDFPYILVMESSRKKIYQYYKNPKTSNLDYVRQYYFNSLNELTGFMPDLGNKRLLVTDKNRVYATPLLN